MREAEAERELVTPGEVLGKASDFIAGKGAYVASENPTVYASLTGYRSIVPPSPDSPDQRPTVEVTCHKAHGVVPVPGSIVIARLSLGDARAYFLSTAKNELGVVSAESGAGAKMVPISWTEMQCPVTGQVEQRKVAKVGE